MFNKNVVTNRKAGFSLVEVIVAMTIFGFVSMGIVQGVTQLKISSRSLSFQQSVDDSLTGYISQIVATDYDTLLNAIAVGNGAQVHVENNYTLATMVDTNRARVFESLILGEWVSHTLLGHDSHLEENSELTEFDASFRLVLRNHEGADIDEDDRNRYISGVIEYRWSPPMRPERSEFRSFIIGDSSSNLG